MTKVRSQKRTLTSAALNMGGSDNSATGPQRPAAAAANSAIAATIAQQPATTPGATTSTRTTASDRAARAAGRSGAARAKSDRPKNRAHMKLSIARRLRKKVSKSLVNQCLRDFGRKPMKHCDNFERLAGLLLTPD